MYAIRSYYAPHVEVFPDRHPEGDPRPVRHVVDPPGDPFVGRKAGDILAVVDDPPGGRRNQARDRLEEGGFSGPVRAEDRQNLSRPGGQGDPGNGPYLAEPDREVV